MDRLGTLLRGPTTPSHLEVDLVNRLRVVIGECQDLAEFCIRGVPPPRTPPRAPRVVEPPRLWLLECQGSQWRLLLVPGREILLLDGSTLRVWGAHLIEIVDAEDVPAVDVATPNRPRGLQARVPSLSVRRPPRKKRARKNLLGREKERWIVRRIEELTVLVNLPAVHLLGLRVGVDPSELEVVAEVASRDLDRVVTGERTKEGRRGKRSKSAAKGATSEAASHLDAS